VLLNPTPYPILVTEVTAQMAPHISRDSGHVSVKFSKTVIQPYYVEEVQRAWLPLLAYIRTSYQYFAPSSVYVLG
jgi:hypothetical protein